MVTSRCEISGKPGGTKSGAFTGCSLNLTNCYDTLTTYLKQCWDIPTRSDRVKKGLKFAISKLTGISTTFFGISWQPSTTEAEIVKRLLIYFESKRSLGINDLGISHHGIGGPQPTWLSMSVIQVRDQAVASMQTMQLSRSADNVINIIASSCNKFLSNLESEPNSYSHLLALWQRDMASCIYLLCRNVEVYPGNQLCLLLEWRLPSNVRLSDLEKFI
ncbi:DUF6650 family protein [Pseudomonas syringae]|uniref:DUF6650 family protein n=1 Tax=Pseudomonas syringae TaxID=317 RepID=UPI0034E966F0